MPAKSKKTTAAPSLKESGLTASTVIIFPIGPELSIQTTISGSANQNAVVAIIAGSVTLWSVTLTQFVDKGVTPFPVSAGGVTIETGATFDMTIPAANQQGSVFASLTTQTQTAPPVQFGGVVATWGLPPPSPPG